jgi:predicted RNA-binding protein with TRAM domain
MKRILISLSFIVFSFFTATSQNDWQWMMHDRSQNFFDIQADFQLYYDQKVGADGVIPKGSGIKPFKRWEYYWKDRVSSTGEFPQEGIVLAEVENYMRTHAQSRNYIAGTGTWTELGPVTSPTNGTVQPNGNGRVTCIAFHPTDANTIYVGAPAGGVWKSTDGGSSWTKGITGLTRLGVSSIVIHPSDPNTIYIGTGDRDGGDVSGYGVWRSTDGGLTWSSFHSGMPDITVAEIIMDPSDADKMYAACFNGYIYRTTNGGSSWSASNGLGKIPKDLAMHPTDPDIIYVGTSSAEFHRSTDGGVSFTEITSGLSSGSRTAIAVSADEPDYVYVLVGDGSGLVGIYRSTNSGVSFSTRTLTPNILGYSTTGSDSGSQAWYDLVIAADPNDADIIYTGGINIWKSVDGGSTMTLTAHWFGSGGAPAVHADQHALEFSPHSGSLYNGNDGGIYVSANAGTDWTDISSGLGIAQLHKIGVSQQTYDLCINGHQDNGTAINRGEDFTTEIGGDGMECIIDPTDDTYMYGALYYGDIRRSSNGGTSFSGISSPIGETGAWVTPYKLDPNNADRMYAGYNEVWRTNDVKAATPVWSKISSFSGSDHCTDLAVAPSNSSVMFVSREGTNKFYRTANATASPPTWTNITFDLPASGTPKDIEIDPTDATHLFIALSNDIYESSNSGASWTNFSGTLPNIPLNTIIIDKNSPLEAMYVGMDVGVYYKDNTLADWLSYSTNLPNIEVTELEIYDGADNCKGSLYAATYGQGLWRSDLKDPESVGPVVCFEASSTNVCSGSPVTFTDFSSYTPIGWTWAISPATFTYIGGTHANSQNPEVVFNAAGVYDVSLTAVNSSGDGVETKVGYVTVYAGTSAGDFNDDLESYSNCGTSSDCGTTTCTWSGSLWTNLTNGSEDDIDWRIDAGGTPSTGTGPSTDYSPGTGSGKYAYTEASACYGNGSTAILESDCLELNSAIVFSFAYHMDGASMGDLHLDLFHNGVWANDLTPVISGDQGTSWSVGSVDLTAYTGSTIKLRLRGITGSGFASDIAIDDLRFTTKFYWTGTTSTDWAVSSNWNNGTVPTSSDDVYITSVPTNQPHVTLAPGTPAVCNNLEVQSGATLTIDAGKALTASGATSNEGTFLIETDATGIGSFMDNGTITGSGSFQMEQYLTGAGGGTPNGVFYYVGSPVVGATSATYGIPAANKLWQVNEATQTYPQITTSGTVLNPMEGYVARMGADGVVTFSGSNFNTGPQSDNSITRTGTVEDNRGYNLMSNPYPSTVNLTTASKPNLENTFWYRTHQGTTMTYDTYNLSGSGTGTNNNGNGAVNQFIPPTQAFWVRVATDNTTGALSFSNSDRSHGTLTGIYKTEAQEGMVKMTLSNGTLSDEAIVQFDTDALDGFDDYDSHKFWASAVIPQLYMNTAEDTLVINGLYSIATNPIVDLGMKLPAAGDYTLTANSITVVDESVYLEDRQFGIFQNLNIESNYDFTSVSGNVSNRFALHFGMAVTGISDDTGANSRVYTSNINQLHIVLSDGKEKGIARVMDMTGRLVMNLNLTSTVTSFEMSVNSGIYLVVVDTEKGTDSHRVILQ